MHTPTDTELWELVKQDDREAFELLYRRHMRPLYAAIYKWALSKADAEDILQEAFLDVWEKRQSINIGQHIFNYLYSITRYKVFDYIKLAIRLHFDDEGNIPSGKYIIRNNQVVTGPITPHSMELLGYLGPLGQIYGGFNQELRTPENNDTAQYYYSLVMEIDSMNSEQHLITGFIDTLMVADKSDTSRKVLITGGEFAVYYNFFEIRINGVPEAPAGQWNGDPTTQNSGGGWADFWQFNFDDGRQFTYGWDPTVWTEENINQFNSARGKGIFKVPYPGELYWAISYADMAGTYSFSCSDTLTIQLDNFNTSQFAKGKLFFKAREIDMNTYTSFIPGGPEIDVEIAFAYRELL